MLLAVLGICVSCHHPEPEPEPNADEGALSGVFSVGPNTHVKFSKGNLQYQATTATWRFAEKQYDMIGAANANASANYGGWIDLFGWATSGWDCGNTYYMPYEQGYVDNYSLGMGYGPLPVGTASLTGEYANCDWGVYNAISNGGNKAGMWRTLTQAEWEYLINGRTNAANKYGLACIEGQNGLVVLPDNWVLPKVVRSTPVWALATVCSTLPPKTTTLQNNGRKWRKTARCSSRLPADVTILNMKSHTLVRWAATGLSIAAMSNTSLNAHTACILTAI